MTSLIYQRLIQASKDIGAIGKTKKNESQNYQYRGIEAVMNAVNPVFINHGIVVFPEIMEEKREDRQTAKGGHLIYTVLKIKYTFVCVEDGSQHIAVVIGEGMDSGDKSGNKAMSCAFKYAMGQVLCIPFDVIDSEQDSPVVNGKAQPKKDLLPQKSLESDEELEALQIQFEKEFIGGAVKNEHVDSFLRSLYRIDALHNWYSLPANKLKQILDSKDVFKTKLQEFMKVKK